MKSIVCALVVLFLSVVAFAVDGQVLINQATVTAAGGFPYKIMQPGSYKLSSNLTVTSSSSNAIEIQSSGVTLDLNGFAIIGPATCSGDVMTLTYTCTGSTAYGVAVFFSTGGGATIKNGTVQGFKRGVLSAETPSIISEIHAIGNVTGIYAEGIIDRCEAHGNNLGFSVQMATVSNSSASGNGGDGFLIYEGPATITNSVSASNGGVGIEINHDFSYLLPSSQKTKFMPSTLAHNTVVNNAMAGILVGHNLSGFYQTGPVVVNNMIMGNGFYFSSSQFDDLDGYANTMQQSNSCTTGPC